MEHYLAVKRKEIPTHSTTWMNLKEIMLSEISGLQKNKYSGFQPIWGTLVKFIEIESRKVFARY